MKEQEPNEQELRELFEELEPARLEVLDEVPGNMAEDVEILKPVASEQTKARSFEPDVTGILDQDEGNIDSEALWGGHEKKSLPMGWFVLGGVAVLGLAGWAVMNVFEAQPSLKGAVDEMREMEVDSIKEMKEVRQTLDLMQDCVLGYLMATSVEEKLPYVRHPDRVKPMMQAFYKGKEMTPKSFRGFERIRSIGLENQSFVYGQVDLLDGGKYRILLEQLDDGTFRVDWESDVCYLPVAWNEYLEKSPPAPVVMRVFIKRDNFYAYEFRDEDRFDCYQLTTRDSDDHLFGFVEKDSRVAMDISHFLKRIEDYAEDTPDPDPEPLMLRLRFPENSHSKKCVWIDTMVAPRWTYVKSPELAKPGDE
ncbi:MAG: hypothetical protein KJO21_00355 [Verrucomicrobiae bacterium]|nr:hypothetical protein [Verrucomicrobiae bacterium]NNJ41984.1 hypothetical protein [Akkermansiaceae bacterium]